jgi:hypothetical protein
MKSFPFCFNLLLAIAAILCVLTVGVRVYEQLIFQLNDPRGGDSMWPMTFQGFLVLASVLSPLAACSVLFNHSHKGLLRATAIVTIIAFLVSWIYGAALLLRQYDSFTGPSDFSYPAISGSQILDNMAGFDGGPFMFMAIVLLSVAAITGRGPVSVVGNWFQKK